MIEKYKTLLPQIQKENELRKEKFGESEENINFHSWGWAEEVYKDFLKGLDGGNLDRARDSIGEMKNILKFFSDRLRDFYEITKSAEDVIDVRGKDEMEVMRAWSFGERRKRNLANARRMIASYMDYLRDLEKKLDMSNREDIFHLGTLYFLMCDRSNASCLMADATLDRTCRILELSTDDKEYTRQINELKRKTISTLARYVASLELSKNFDSVVSNDGKTFGVHGEYDHNYYGESSILISISEPLNFLVTLIDVDENDIRSLKDKIKKTVERYKLEKDVEKRILSKIDKASDLIENFYGLDNIREVCVDARQLEIIAKERGRAIEQLFRRGGCRVIPLFQIHSYLQPHILQITDVLVQFISDKLGKPTDLDEQMKYAKNEYLEKHSPALLSMASSLLVMNKFVEAVENKKTIPYHPLLECLKELKASCNKLYSPSGILLIAETGKSHEMIRRDLRSTINEMERCIEEYRKNLQFPDEMKTYIDSMLKYTKRGIERLETLKSSSDINKSYLV